MPRENVWTEGEIEAGLAEFNRLFDGLCRTAPLDARIRIVDVGFPRFSEGSMMELVFDQIAEGLQEALEVAKRSNVQAGREVTQAMLDRCALRLMDQVHDIYQGTALSIVQLLLEELIDSGIELRLPVERLFR